MKLHVQLATLVTAMGCTLACGGVTLIKTSGVVSASARATLNGQSTSFGEGGPFESTQAVSSFGSAAFAGSNYTDAARSTASAYAITGPTKIAARGSANSIAASLAATSSSSTEARSDVQIVVDVDTKSEWRLASGWQGSNTDSVYYTLRQVGRTDSIFDSRTTPWQGAAGVLEPGAYELAVRCSTQASISGGSTLGFAASDVNDAYYIIDIEVTEAPAETLAADFNGDGFLDFTDFDAFVAAFESGEATADVTQDGFLDFTDFDAFVWVFESGTAR
jgi:hypothetical protein